MATQPLLPREVTDLSHPMVPAKQAFMTAINAIRNGSTSQRVHDATYSLELLSAAFWPEASSPETMHERWEPYGLTTLQARLADLLLTRLGKLVSWQAFLHACYFDRRDWPCEKLFSVTVCHIRKKLAKSPYRIENVHGLGYRMELKNAQAAKKAA